MTLFQLYLFLVVLPNACNVATGLAVFFTVASLVSLLIGALLVAERNINESKQAFKWAKISGIIAFIIVLCTVPFPTKDQLEYLAGGYVVTNTKDISKLPDNIVKAANSYLEHITLDKDKK